MTSSAHPDRGFGEESAGGRGRESAGRYLHIHKYFNRIKYWLKKHFYVVLRAKATPTMYNVHLYNIRGSTLFNVNINTHCKHAREVRLDSELVVASNINFMYMYWTIIPRRGS